MLNPRKESKLHAKSDEHFATKGDLKDTEYRLNIAILSTNHEIKETELRLKAEIVKLEGSISNVETKLEGAISNVEARLTGEIKALNRDKILDRSILIGVFLMMIGYLIKTFIHQ